MDIDKRIARLTFAKKLVFTIATVLILVQLSAQIYEAIIKHTDFVWFMVIILHRIGVMAVLFVASIYLIESQRDILIEIKKRDLPKEIK